MLVLGSVSLWAQSVPKAEVYGGFSAVNIDDPGFKTTPFGWAASVNANVHKVVGIVGDFSGNYRDGNKFHSFLGGTQFTSRLDKVSVFAQTKAGMLRAETGTSSTHFQLGFGGGIDWNVNDKVAVRLAQFDWLPTKEKAPATGWVKNITRLSAGVVFKSKAK